MQNNLESNNGAKPPFIPFETAWASLQPALEAEAQQRKREKRRIFFWWGFSACVVLIIASWALLQHYNDASPIVTKSNSIENNAPVKKQVTAADTRVVKGVLPLEKKSNNPQNDAAILPNATEQKCNVQVLNNANLANTEAIPSSNSLHVRTTPNSEAKENLKAPKKIFNSLPSLVAKRGVAKAIASEAVDSFTNWKKTVSTNSSGVTGLSKVSTSNLANTANEPVALFGWQATAPPNYTAYSKAIIDTLLSGLPTHSASLVNNKGTKPYHFGLLWNVPLHQFSAPYRSNKPDRYLQMVLPQFWAGLDIQTKHRIGLRLNTFAQLYLGQSILLSKSSYQTIVHQASQQKQENNYTETVYLQQISGLEAGLTYQYLFAPKWRIGASISGLKTNDSWLHNTITKNGNQVAKDSVYKTEKSSSVGQRIAPLVFKTGLELQYQIKQIALGLQVNMPLTAPINTNIPYTLTPNFSFSLNWQIK